MWRTGPYHCPLNRFLPQTIKFTLSLSQCELQIFSQIFPPWGFRCIISTGCVFWVESYLSCLNQVCAFSQSAAPGCGALCPGSACSGSAVWSCRQSCRPSGSLCVVWCWTKTTCVWSVWCGPPGCCWRHTSTWQRHRKQKHWVKYRCSICRTSCFTCKSLYLKHLQKVLQLSVFITITGSPRSISADVSDEGHQVTCLTCKCPDVIHAL